MLVVDDEESVHLRVRKALAAMHLVHSYNGWQTRDALKNHRDVGVALLDLNLPDTSGFVLLDEIRAMENPPAVVVFSSEPRARVATQAFERGAYAYLEKSREQFQRLADIVHRAALDRRAAPERPRLVGCCQLGWSACGRPATTQCNHCGLLLCPTHDHAGVGGDRLCAVCARLEREFEAPHERFCWRRLRAWLAEPEHTRNLNWLHRERLVRCATRPLTVIGSLGWGVPTPTTGDPDV